VWPRHGRWRLQPQRVGYPLDAPGTRDPATVRAELVEAKDQLAASAPSAAGYPALLRRVAELQRERAANATRSGDKKSAEEATRATVEPLERLVRDFPKFCAAPPAGCGDEQLYLLARTYQQLGARDEARRRFLQLIQDSPGSPYVVAAYFAFADMFLAESTDDPSKLELADQAYQQVTSRAQPEHELFRPALARLALVEWKRGDYTRALSSTKKTIEHAAARRALPGAEQDELRARADLVMLFALAGEPRGAAEYFRPLSGGRLATTVEMLDTLRGYLVGQRAYDGAIIVAFAADQLGPSPVRCRRQVAILELVAWGTRRADSLTAELSTVADRLAEPSAPADCRTAAASIAIAAVVARDLEVIGTAAAPGPRDAAAVDDLRAAYAVVLSTFTAADVAAAVPVRVAAADWPTHASLTARAALLAQLASPVTVAP
jgi:tetratricopeptide (TPR) repeat protein